MSSKCQSCGVVGLSANDVDLAREIVGDGWETMCVPCAESLAKHNKSESFHTGFEAAKQGEKITNNPYAKGVFGHDEWIAGFQEFSKEVK